MPSDVLIHRRIVSSPGDTENRDNPPSVIVELIVVPWGEGAALTQLDLNSTTLVQFLEQDEWSTAHDLAWEKTDASHGLATLGEDWDRVDQEALVAILRDNYLPVPSSPELQALELGASLANAIGFRISLGGEPIGISVNASVGLVVLLVASLRRPTAALISPLAQLAIRHVTIVADRSLARWSGRSALPPDFDPIVGRQLTPAPGSLRVERAAGPWGANGTFGAQDGVNLALSVLVTNESDDPMTIVGAGINFDDGRVATLQAFQEGSGRNRTTTPTIDLGAHMARQFAILLNVRGVVRKGESLRGSLALKTSHPRVLADPLWVEV